MASVTIGEATREETPGRLTLFNLPRTRAVRWLAWSIFVTCLVATTAGLLLALLAEPSEPDFEDRTFDFVILSYPLAGAWILTSRPDNRVGWLFCITGLFWAAARFSHGYEEYALSAAEPGLPAGEAASWLAAWIWVPALFVMLFLLPMCFPTGRQPSRRWRPVAWVFAVAAALASVYRAFSPEFQDGADEGEDNPLGLGGVAGDLFEGPGFFEVFMPLAVIASFIAVVSRFRAAGSEERQQLKWAVAAIAVLLVGFSVQITVGSVGGVDPAVFGLVAFPIAATIAILRYRLYEIDLILNRALVYGALTALIVGVYVLMVGYLGALFDVGSNLPVSLAAAGAVAVLFEPLRRWLQRTVNRFFYGYRDEPYIVLTQLGQRLEATLAPEAVLPAIVETVAEAMRSPHVAIALKHDDEFEIAASYGDPQTAPTTILPLTHQQEEVGQIMLAPRGPREAFDANDRTLLNDLARQAGIAAHAVRLTYDLQRSRERLVTAREEERRRLRRDLHDGLGPTLAAATLKLDAARSSVAADPAEADHLLAEVKTETQQALADIRRLVYGLRPPALDELGLVGALRAQAASLTDRAGTTAKQLAFTIEAPEPLPSLPAATEVAAYRIAAEAMTNVARHAGARSCLVRISHNGWLELEVSDDGKGISEDTSRGVGITSMRERAAELGGSCEVTSSSKEGTRVVARLPTQVTSGG